MPRAAPTCTHREAAAQQRGGMQGAGVTRRAACMAQRTSRLPPPPAQTPWQSRIRQPPSFRLQRMQGRRPGWAGRAASLAAAAQRLPLEGAPRCDAVVQRAMRPAPLRAARLPQPFPPSTQAPRWEGGKKASRTRGVGGHQHRLATLDACDGGCLEGVQYERVLLGQWATPSRRLDCACSGGRGRGVFCLRGARQGEAGSRELRQRRRQLRLSERGMVARRYRRRTMERGVEALLLLGSCHVVAWRYRNLMRARRRRPFRLRLLGSCLSRGGLLLLLLQG